MELAVLLFGILTVWQHYEIKRGKRATDNLAKYVVFLLEYVRDGKLVLTEQVANVKQDDTKGKGPLGFIG